MIRVLHVADSDTCGGAARAGYRIHCALLEYGSSWDVQSRMRVIRGYTGDTSVSAGEPREASWPWKKIRPKLLQRRYRRFHTNNDTAHSIAWPDTGLLNELNNAEVEIVHLHWLGNNVLSVEEIGRLRKPVVWTLHDQWPFCGAEHYSPLPPAEDHRPFTGYYQNNRGEGESGPDLNRWTWERKKQAWRNPMHLVVTSRWLESAVSGSALLGHWPIIRIPYPLDLHQWYPVSRHAAREALGLPLDVPLVLFGAHAGMKDRRKGADLLLDALCQLRHGDEHHPASRAELVTFGPTDPADCQVSQVLPVHHFGSLSDTVTLRMLYSAASVMVVPSRLEAFGQTASEAQACGTPVVAFANTGVADVIKNRYTGFLASAINADALAQALDQLLQQDQQELDRMGKAARQRAECLWSPQGIAQSYCNLYEKVASRLF